MNPKTIEHDFGDNRMKRVKKSSIKAPSVTMSPQTKRLLEANSKLLSEYKKTRFSS
ncbi:MULTISPECIES: hypothetical protein [Bacillaceae]|uniref:Uncharacterized protein n=1 Tax=Metabacillus sediminis TaxID=3117746 RepID=A0ABZ2NN17_9BACI|nr:hypothetical protein [Bacillus sp. SJS]